MGKFGESFKKELGKNTGKAVSTMVFGNKHATPHRVDASVDIEKARAEAEVEVERQKRYARELELEAEKERLHLERSMAMEDELSKKIEETVKYRFSKDKWELLDQLSELSVQIKANPYKRKSKGVQKVRNEYFDVLLEKYKQGILTLKSIDPNEPQVKLNENFLRKTVITKIYKKFSVLIWIIVILVIFIVLGSIPL